MVGNAYGMPSGFGLDCTQRAWAFLQSQGPALGLPGLRVETLDEFQDRVNSGAAEKAGDREALIDQAALLLENYYAHRLYKEPLYGVKPLDALRSLRVSAAGLDVVEFHTRMLEIFDSVRDAHTNYVLPEPFASATAILPFQLRRVQDARGNEAFLVTNILTTGEGEQFGGSLFTTGAKVLTWNGAPIEEAIRAANEVGGNSAAAISRGVQRLTLRPLGHSRLPDEEFVDVGFLPPGQFEAQDLMNERVRWGVLAGLPPGQFLPQEAFSLNPAQSELRRAETVLWGHDRIRECQEMAAATSGKEAGAVADDRVLSRLPEQFRFQHTRGVPRPKFVRPGDLVDPAHPEKRFGYVRILQFSQPGLEPGNVDVNANEFRRILELLNEVAPDGLIVDIRGNGGGDIRTAERELQMLIPERLAPAHFHMANNDAVHSMLGAAGDAGIVGMFRGVGPNSADGRLTEGRALTNTQGELDRGQAYMGPVVLVIDGLTYSAADIFAGGFADNGIGRIVGVDEATGGGGASVWSYAEVVANAGRSGSRLLTELPMGVGMRVAALRSSRANRAGLEFIEDVGVAAERPAYLPTIEDVIGPVHDPTNGTFGALWRQLCGTVLSGAARPRVDLVKADFAGSELTVVVRTGLVDSVVFGVELETFSSDGNSVSVSVAAPEVVPVTGGGEVTRVLELRASGTDGVNLRVTGMAGGKVGAVLWRQLRGPIFVDLAAETA